MLMACPFCNFGAFWIRYVMQQYIALVIEVVEYDHLRIRLAEKPHHSLAVIAYVRYAPPDIAHFRRSGDRLELERIPVLPSCKNIGIPVVSACDVFVGLLHVMLVIHRDKYLVSVMQKNPGIYVMIDAWVFRIARPHHVLLGEIGLVAEISVCDEHRNVVRPGISRGCRKHYPPVRFGYLQERFCPGAIADNPLLVEYEEAAGNSDILLYIVPGIDNDPVGI